MNRWPLVSLAGMAIFTAVVMEGQGTRSMRPDGATPDRRGTRFNPAQSAALFVGARTFTHDKSLEAVPYAVDDAVDLAYTFSIDPRVALVPPKRVMLALSDPVPRKPISRRRLAELKRRGAVVAPATQSHILNVLAQQAATVGPDGIFIVSFASHGFSDEGTQYLLATNSRFTKFDTAIPTSKILDIASKSKAARSLILIDTCRERVQKRRATSPEPLSAAPLIQRMNRSVGQVVLYAAAAGQWAYDDDLRQNGVFTGAVLDGLQCRAGHDAGGLVTVDALSASIERTVLTWIRTNRDPFILNATQISADGAARTMPVAICSRPAPKDPPVLAQELMTSPASASRSPLRPQLEDCRDDGKSLVGLYETQSPDRFVTTYLAWRDGCVAVLRDLDSRLPQREPETARFLSASNLWCATQCPAGMSAARCALFQENARAERCAWDLAKAVPHVEEVLIRNAKTLQGRGVPGGAQP